MAKFKLTKGELKRQRDALRQYERYLPTLQLKKQQLQMEILRWNTLLQEKNRLYAVRREAAQAWAGLLAEAPAGFKNWVAPDRVEEGVKNVAGVNVPVFLAARFADIKYDLFMTAPWVDQALEALRQLSSLAAERAMIHRAVKTLNVELRVTAQRVNLFEKVKIPEAEEAIRRIKICIGDQMANAVGRSKMAKRKIEEMVCEGAAA
jgi:V/A-type H+-transporting ATPase subunit D